MKKEDLHFLIDRYDHYYDSINNKSQFLLGLNTFIIGGSVALYAYVIEKHYKCEAIYWFIALILVLSIASATITLFAILPYLKSKKTSLLYFGSVAKYNESEYHEAVNNLSDDELYKDLSIQTNHLAKGLAQKYYLLRIAGWILLFEFLLIIPLLVICFKSIK